MKRKKILFIARWYPDKHDPMLGLFVQKHACAVQILNDVTVLYVTADNTLSPGKFLIDETNYDGIHEIRIYFGKGKISFLNALNYARYYFKGVSISKSKTGKPNLVHVHILSRAAFPALWLKYTQNIPYIITEHWSRYLPVNLVKGAYSGWLRILFTRVVVKAACAVTTVTQNLALAMQSLGLKNRYFITPNVADTNLFRISENKNNGRVKRLIHVTCFDEPAKNLKGIINVVKVLAGKRDDFLLDIIGDGIDFNSVKSYAEETGLVDQRIYFHGLLLGEELAQKMRNADAMVMFSNYENLPCTIVESLCCGVPVISTDVGGIKEHLLPEFGILISSGNEKQLSQAMLTFLDNPEKFNSNKIMNYGASHFSFEALSKGFESVYAECYK